MKATYNFWVSPLKGATLKEKSILEFQIDGVHGMKGVTGIFFIFFFYIIFFLIIFSNDALFPRMITAKLKKWTKFSCMLDKNGDWNKDILGRYF